MSGRYAGHKILGSFLAGALVSGMALNAIFMRWPPDADVLFGTTGAVASLAAIFGVIGAFAAGIGVYVSHKANRDILAHARQADTASRFQKGAEMLGRSESASMAGIAVIEECAREDAQRYSMPAVRTLLYYGRECDRATFLSMPFFVQPRNAFKPNWHHQSSSSAAEAVAALSRIAHANWPTGDLLDHGRLVVSEVYLTDKFFDGDDFSRLYFFRQLWNCVIFNRCNLRNSKIMAVVGNEIVLGNCDLTGASIDVKSEKGEPIAPQRTEKFKIVTPTGTTGALINGYPYDEWAAIAASSTDEVGLGSEGSPVVPAPAGIQ